MTCTDQTLLNRIESLAAKVEAKVLNWRRDFHANPELSNREYRTSEIVAKHLRQLGLEVETGIAHTGVVGILHGATAGKVVALRADMDALPVCEEVDLPFASKVTGDLAGQKVGVMHACGHDAHTAILMGVAEVLSLLSNELKGTVKFIFQPAEEGPPEGEYGGAAQMIKEGVLENPKPDAIFGLHVIAGIKVGKIGYRSGPTLASGDEITIDIHGRQTHAAFPWHGVDPIVIASQIVLAMQTIPSRQLDITLEPLVLTFSCINGGIRSNIIPETVRLVGTLRTFNQAMRDDAKARIKAIAELIAKSAGGSASIKIKPFYDVTANDEELTKIMVPTLQRVAGDDNTFIAQKLMGSEDFSAYQAVIPGFFFLLGITSPGETAAAPNHSPQFRIDETGLILGVRSLAHLAVDFLHGS